MTLEDLRSGARVHAGDGAGGEDQSRSSGTRVKKGDPLAVIESPDIGNAVSDVHKAEADLIAAEHDFKRKKELFEQKAGSAADQEASEDNWRKAKAEVERARQKAYLLRARQRRHGDADVHAALADRRRGAHDEHQPGHGGAGPVQRRRGAGALHDRRDRQGLGDRRRLRDGSGARAGRRAPPGSRSSRTRTRSSTDRSTG